MSGLSDSLLPELADVAGAMTRRRDAPHVLGVLCRRLDERLRCVGVGASLVTGNRVYFTTAVPDSLKSLQALERHDAAAASIRAVRAGRPVYLDQLDGHREVDTRFAAMAVAAGVEAAVVLPFGTPNPAGAISLYWDAQRDWTADDLHLATLLSTLAATFIRAGAEVERHRRRYEDLKRACRRRALVEQAKGMIAAQQAIGVDAAFAVLHRYANDHNATLAEVADAVINLGLQL
jgi:hypothetical protein